MNKSFALGCVFYLTPRQISISTAVVHLIDGNGPVGRGYQNGHRKCPSFAPSQPPHKSLIALFWLCWCSTKRTRCYTTSNEIKKNKKEKKHQTLSFSHQIFHIWRVGKMRIIPNQPRHAQNQIKVDEPIRTGQISFQSNAVREKIAFLRFIEFSAK